MSKVTRRDFIRFAGAATIGTFGLPAVGRAQMRGQAHVVVVGGGFGGATCARYLRHLDPAIRITLIEPVRQFVTCPFSNYVIAGWRSIDTISHSFTPIQRAGVEVVHDRVTAIDPGNRRVRLGSGGSLAYDRLVVSPGIDFRWGAIEGYDENAVEIMPHAWKAGPQTLLLRRQLEAMRDGGTFLMVAPANPFRCPPGPYERASVVANYFKRHKPRSKVVILDQKEGFSKQPLFMDGWQKLYPGMIEWIPASKGGKVNAVNPRARTLEGDFDRYKADVVNFIPPQRAGEIARTAGLTDDSGWCPVDPQTFESKRHRGIYVIGDASIASPMPKSGFAANSQGKRVARVISAELRGEAPDDGVYTNTCYSLLAPDYGISVAGVYRLTQKGIVSVEGAGGVSPRDADADFRADEAKYTLGWYASITRDVWG